MLIRAHFCIQVGSVITVLCPQVTSTVLSTDENEDEIEVSIIRVDQPSFVWIDDQHIDHSAQTILKIEAQSE